jgi:hypothetical protein
LILSASTYQAFQRCRWDSNWRRNSYNLSRLTRDRRRQIGVRLLVIARVIIRVGIVLPANDILLRETNGTRIISWQALYVVSGRADHALDDQD